MSEIDETILGMLRQIQGAQQGLAVLTKEFQSLRRDIERIGSGVEKINERHEKIRVSCSDHIANTKIATEAANEALHEIRDHKQYHMAWSGIIISIIALLNLPVGDLFKRVLGWPTK